MDVKAIVSIEELGNGKVALTLRHPKHQGQWAKFLITGGGNLLERAVQAVYREGAGDADAFFEAAGMTIEQFIQMLKLPYDVVLKSDPNARPGEKRCEGWAQRDRKLGPDTTVVSVNFITDAGGNGSCDLGMEICYTSREDRGDDDLIDTFETMLVQDLLQKNPFLEEESVDWDRERGETEWSSKYIFKLRGPRGV